MYSTCSVRTLTLILVAGFMTASQAAAQSQSCSPCVSTERDHLAVAPPPAAIQFRVEVFSPGGTPVFDSGFLNGQTIRWDLRDSRAQPVPDGVYVVLLSTTNAEGKVRKTIEQVIVSRRLVQQLLKAPIAKLQSVGDDQPIPAALHQSTGTPGKISKWIASDTLGDSIITEDANKIGIANQMPTATLHVDSAQPSPAGSGTDAATLLQTSGGRGGDATTAGATAGRGADISLLAGNGGDAAQGVSGTGGSITLQPGSPGIGAGSGQRGRILLAPFGGNVGIGTLNTASKLSVEGDIQIEGIGNGLKFADGTIQTTSAMTTILHDATLTGDGSTASPLGLSVPLNLSGSSAGAIFSVSNSASGPAITATGIINTSTHYSIGGNRVLSVAGASNVFAGVGAGINNSGTGNSFFGQEAGRSNTIGHSNSFFGLETGRSNTSGHTNSFFGVYAGRSNTDGCCNAFFGSTTGINNTTGSENSFFGTSAGHNNTTGANNTFIGRDAGNNNTSGSGNTFVGGHAGSIPTTGNQNTFIGWGAGTLLKGLTNAAAIGYRATVTQDNSLVLGSINGVQFASADTNVGIGTTAPTSKLEVRNGEIKSSGSTGGRFTALNPNNQGAVVLLDWFNDGTRDWPRIRYGGDGQGATNGFLIQGTSNVTKLAILHNGNVGIGTAAPSARLHVQGNAIITGNLSKGGGSFKIDHPLDPANKYLLHSFVESPDMMNVYNGNIRTDVRGRAVVRLPDYFEALNRDFRYQLTVIGQFAQVVVLRKVRANRFVIRTDRPRVEVSWQVTGIRRDAYADANRIAVEEDKPASERGTYLHPELFRSTTGENGGNGVNTKLSTAIIKRGHRRSKKGK